MGRRKGRKRRRQRDRESLGVEALRRSEARRRRQSAEADGFPAALALPSGGDGFRALTWQAPDRRDLLALVRNHGDPRAKPKLTCTGCHEFVPNDDAGRGRCLHPGSGVFSPWPDTEACQFHEARRRR